MVHNGKLVANISLWKFLLGKPKKIWYINDKTYGFS